MRRDNFIYTLLYIIVLDHVWSTSYLVRKNSTKFGLQEGNKIQYTEWRRYKCTCNYIMCNFYLCIFLYIVWHKDADNNRESL
jgi:hypothetical protein